MRLVYYSSINKNIINVCNVFNKNNNLSLKTSEVIEKTVDPIMKILLNEFTEKDIMYIYHLCCMNMIKNETFKINESLINKFRNVIISIRKEILKNTLKYYNELITKCYQCKNDNMIESNIFIDSRDVDCILWNHEEYEYRSFIAINKLFNNNAPFDHNKLKIIYNESNELSINRIFLRNNYLDDFNIFKEYNIIESIFCNFSIHTDMLEKFRIGRTFKDTMHDYITCVISYILFVYNSIKKIIFLKYKDNNELLLLTNYENCKYGDYKNINDMNEAIVEFKYYNNIMLLKYARINYINNELEVFI